MEKILFAVDNQQMDEQAVHFACYLARLTGSELTGVFLKRLQLEEEVIYQQSGEQLNIESVTIREARESNNTLLKRNENMELFKEIAGLEEVQASIHLDKGVPEAEIIAESRFADLLIMDASTSFSGIQESAPTLLVRNILHDAGCPVMIAPEYFEGIDHIIFCYDGSKSAVFAMKQFAHLFPQLKSNPVKILFLNQEEPGEDEVEKVTEWLSCHFDNDIEYIIPEEDIKDSLFEYLVARKDDLVVMGAYGKGLLNSFFRADEEGGAVRKSVLPIFVSHF